MLLNRSTSASCEGVLTLLSSRCVAMRLALTHLSTVKHYTPARSPIESGELYPPSLVSNALICLDKFFRRPTNLIHLYPPFSASRRALRRWKSVTMAIEAPLSVRAAAESQREAGREAAVQYLLTRAGARRDQRVEEAKASAAALPTVAERAAEAPPPRRRPPSGSALLDVLA